MIFSLGPPSNTLVTRVSPSWRKEFVVGEICAEIFIIQRVNLVSHSEIIIQNYPVAPLMLEWLV